MSRVVVHKRAAKYLKRLPEARRESVKRLLAEIGKNPASFPGVKQMAGEWVGYRRIRAGNLRVIFWLDSAKDIVYIDHIGPRGDMYKTK